MIENLKGIEKFEEALKLFSEKKYEKAGEKFSEIINDSSISLPIRNRSEVFYKRCKNILNPVKNSPEKFEDYLDFAVYYLNFDRTEEAKKYLKEAEKKNSEHHLLYYIYAILNVKEKNYNQAIEYLKKSIELNEKNRIFARNDPDFEPMQNYEPFTILVSEEDV